MKIELAFSCSTINLKLTACSSICMLLADHYRHEIFNAFSLSLLALAKLCNPHNKLKRVWNIRQWQHQQIETHYTKSHITIYFVAAFHTIYNITWSQVSVSKSAKFLNITCCLYIYNLQKKAIYLSKFSNRLVISFNNSVIQNLTFTIEFVQFETKPLASIYLAM